jgi:hypothetical protein
MAAVRGENRVKLRPIQTRMTGLDAARDATGDFLDQNAQNALPRVVRRALIWDGSFHTVCLNSAPPVCPRPSTRTN